MTSAAEEELAALGKRVAELGDGVSECVVRLVTPGELPRFVVAERLVPLGSALIPHLVQLLNDPEIDDDLRGCAAFLGFSVGDREDCAMALLDQIETDGPWSQGAAQKLAEANYPGTGSAIEAALRRLGSTSTDAIVGYLHSFQSAGGSLPNDLRELLAASDQWQVTTALSDLFRESL